MQNSKEAIFLRVNKELSRKLKTQAARLETSINEYCISLLKQSVELKIQNTNNDIKHVVDHALSVFDKSLEAVVLFGSYSRGDNTEESDIDILVVLNKSIKITRDIYNKWSALSNKISEKFSVHFVNLPDHLDSLSGLWCEVSLEGMVLYDTNLRTSKFLLKLREQILIGEYTYSYSHGQRYWKFKKIAA